MTWITSSKKMWKKKESFFNTGEDEVCCKNGDYIKLCIFYMIFRTFLRTPTLTCRSLWNRWKEKVKKKDLSYLVIFCYSSFSSHSHSHHHQAFTKLLHCSLFAVVIFFSSPLCCDSEWLLIYIHGLPYRESWIEGRMSEKCSIK